MSFSALLSRRGRARRSLAAAAIGLALLTVAACGAGDPFDEVSVDAKAGEAPSVEWGDVQEFESTSTQVLIEGEGEDTKVGDVVDAYIWVGNAYEQDQVYSSHDMGEEPETFELLADLPPGLTEVLVGQKAGSTVAVAAVPEDAFGEQGNAMLGIGDGDSVLFVAEIVKKYTADEAKKWKADYEEQAKKAEEEAEKQAKKAEATAKKVEKARKNAPKQASGKQLAPAAWAPKVTYPKGKVPVFDFSKAPEPTGKLQVTKLIQGNGPVVKKGQTLLVHYVGQAFGAEEPFDSSYSPKQAADFQIGVGAVYEGWDKALVGERVGSRVLMQIPPHLRLLGVPAFSDEDILVFSVDILAAI